MWVLHADQIAQQPKTDGAVVTAVQSRSWELPPSLPPLSLACIQPSSWERCVRLAGWVSDNSTSVPSSSRFIGGPQLWWQPLAEVVPHKAGLVCGKRLVFVSAEGCWAMTQCLFVCNSWDHHKEGKRQGQVGGKASGGNWELWQRIFPRLPEWVREGRQTRRERLRLTTDDVSVKHPAGTRAAFREMVRCCKALSNPPPSCCNLHKVKIHARRLRSGNGGSGSCAGEQHPQLENPGPAGFAGGTQNRRARFRYRLAYILLCKKVAEGGKGKMGRKAAVCKAFVWPNSFKAFYILDWQMRRREVLHYSQGAFSLLNLIWVVGKEENIAGRYS